MKNFLSGLVATGLIFGFGGLSSAKAQTFDTNTLTNGLVAYYPFNGNLSDQTGNLNPAENFGTFFTLNRFGFSNSAVGFNGTQYTAINGLGGLIGGHDEAAISAWYLINNGDFNSGFIIPSYGMEGKAPGLELVVSHYGALGGEMGVWQDVYTSFNYGQEYTKWHHIIYSIKKGEQPKIYLDGILQQWLSPWVPATTIGIPNFNSPYGIGARFEGGSPNYFSSGAISDLRFYNRALSSNEVAALYAMESTPPAPPITTDTFGTGTNQLGIDFVTVGNPGNSNDTTGYGGVPYSYRIGKYTISQNQIDAATRNGLQNVTAGGWNGFPNSGDLPASCISWYQAAAYVNWLNTSSGSRPAYNLTYTNGAWSMALWPTTPDTNGNVAWTLGGTNLFRNANCTYFLPSENEWYKAAFGKIDGSGYFHYATGGDQQPTGVGSGVSQGTVILNNDWSAGPASVFKAGGLSSYGTMGQTGNNFQWIETTVDGSNDSPLKNRLTGGIGYWYPSVDFVESAYFWDTSPQNIAYPYMGFRVARVDNTTPPGPTNPQSITFPSIPALTLTNGVYTLGATADSGLPISYAIGDSSIAGITNGNLIPLGVGTTTVVASQAGDTNYLPATPVTNPLVITYASQVYSPTPLSNLTYGSLPFGISIPTNSSGLPITARIVSGPATLSGTNLMITGTGTVTLAYDAPGNSLYASNSVTNSFAVTNGPTNLKSQTITFKSLTAATFGGKAIVSSATATSKLPVTFWSSNTNVAVISGTNIVITGAGQSVITAYQPGDGTTWNPAAPASQTLIVNQASQKLTFKGPAKLTYSSTPVTLSGSSSLGLPVIYTCSDSNVARLSTSGTNTLLTPVGTGTVTITATQPGNANVGAAIPVAQPVVIAPGTQTLTFTLASTNAVYGDSPITLSASSSAGLPVTFAVTPTNVASVSGNTLTITGAGKATVTASQSGSALWAAVKPVTKTLTIAKAPQTISLSLPSSVTYTNGGLLSLAASSTSGLPVAYKSGNAKVLNITGTTCVITGKGTTTVVATQAGNANYLTAPAVTNTVTVR